MSYIHHLDWFKASTHVVPFDLCCDTESSINVFGRLLVDIVRQFGFCHKYADNILSILLDPEGTISVFSRSG